MEVAEIVLKYIETLIYPITIFAIVFLFKKPFKSLLSSSLTAKYKDLTIAIERQKKIINAIEEDKRKVANELENEFEKISSEKPVDTVKKVANLLSALKFEYREKLVLTALKKRDGRGTLFQLEDDWDWDPWREYKDMELVEEAVDRLINRGILIKNDGVLVVANKSILEVI